MLIHYRDCFSKYVHTKTIKRMEAFRVRYSAAGQQRTLLLPISFGVSSITLLHILDHHLQVQKQRTGRTGFGLHIVHVINSPEEASDVESGLINQLKDRYPDHTLSVIQLANVFDNHDATTGLDKELMLEGYNNSDTSPPHQNRLRRLLSSTTSATSRADIISILRTRLLVSFAKFHSYEAILWGDTTTRLAEKTLSETAKGRGFALPWNIADGLSPHGVTFQYPMRDLLKKELISYADMLSPPLPALVLDAPTQAPINSKNTTIDELMKQYFESVEQSYPSIVANVVRTTSKLHAPKSSNKDVECRLCGMPVAKSALGIDGWGGNQEAQNGDVEDADIGLCYGCTRVLPQEAGTLLPAS